MSISDWAGLILTALSIIAITVGGIRWYITAEIKVLSTEIKNNLSELKPNGGSSMKDQVNRLEEKSHRLEENGNKSSQRQVIAERDNAMKFYNKWGGMPLFDEYGMIKSISNG